MLALAKLLAQLATGSACLSSLAALVYANKVAPRRFQLDTVRISVPDCVAPAGGLLRILHLSDLHLCYPETDKIDFLKQITDKEYDLVLLTGDVFENFTGLSYANSILSRQPRLGAYAVFGNHDYYNYNIYNKTIGRFYRQHRHPVTRRDVAPMIEALSRAGFQVLCNKAVRLPEDNLYIVGIDYPSAGEAKLQELVKEAQEGDFILALFHQPLNLEQISAAGVHLGCGGHTHGGQIRLPGLPALFTDSELPGEKASGLFHCGATIFHISRGLGADPRTNFRLFCPPAATLIVVVSDSYH